MNPARMGIVSRLPYRWLPIFVPFAILSFAYAPLLSGSTRRLGRILGDSSEILLGGLFLAAFTLPILGTILTGGRAHSKEGLEQLRLTRLEGDEIAFGAVYWPIRFTFRVMIPLAVLAFLSGLLSHVSSVPSVESRVDLWTAGRLLVGFMFVCLGCLLVAIWLVFTTLALAARVTLGHQDTRWLSVFLVPLLMMPHAFNFLMGLGCIGSFAGLVGDRIELGYDEVILRFLLNSFETFAGLVVGVALLRIQLSCMIQGICNDAAHHYFGSMREESDPQPIWEKAEWSVLRLRSARRRVIEILRGRNPRPPLHEDVIVVAITFLLITLVIVLSDFINVLFPVRSFLRIGYTGDVFDRLWTVGAGPVFVFVFPLVASCVWWILFGQRCGKILLEGEARKAPYLASLYRLLQRELAWIIPLWVAVLGVSLTLDWFGDLSSIPTAILWGIYCVGGLSVAAVSSLHIQESRKPHCSTALWLTLAALLVFTDASRDADTAMRVWELNWDRGPSFVLGILILCMAHLYILPVVAQRARQRDESSSSSIDFAPNPSLSPTEYPTT